MELILIGILTTAALAIVAYPLIHTKKYIYSFDELPVSHEEKKLAFLHSKKKVVDDNIEDLELEHEMGKLSGGDFERLRAGLLTESERVLREIDKTRIKRDIEELIEQEVRSQRRVK